MTAISVRDLDDRVAALLKVDVVGVGGTAAPDRHHSRRGRLRPRPITGGARRDRFAATAASVFADYSELITAFDARAARRYGSMVAEREKAGRPIATADAQIAAICATHEATPARNTGDFEGSGIELVNPWNAQ